MSFYDLQKSIILEINWLNAAQELHPSHRYVTMNLWVFSTHLLILPDLHRISLFFLICLFLGGLDSFLNMDSGPKKKDLKSWVFFLLMITLFVPIYSKTRFLLEAFIQNWFATTTTKKSTNKNPKQQKTTATRTEPTTTLSATDRNIPIFPFCPTPFVGPWNHRHLSWWASLVAS